MEGAAAEEEEEKATRTSKARKEITAPSLEKEVVGRGEATGLEEKEVVGRREARLRVEHQAVLFVQFSSVKFSSVRGTERRPLRRSRVGPVIATTKTTLIQRTSSGSQPES